MEYNNSYCRLCAESKSCNKQVNLQSDDAKRSEIMQKLTRVNATTNFYEDNMPKTVCIDCIKALNKAYDFVVAIERAQSALNRIFGLRKVKKEVESEGEVSEHFECNIEVKFSVKKESDVEDDRRESELASVPIDFQNKTSDSDRETPPRQVKKTKKVKKLDQDTIPLSQLSKQKLTWSSYSWFCTYCETQFASIDELKTHSMALHNICNPYRCTDCKVRKIRLDSFLIHVQRHHKNLRYSCYKCYQQFETAAATRKHKMTHITSKFVCNGCNTSYQSNEELKKHSEDYCQAKRARRIPTVLQSDGLTCKVCQKSFKTKSSLNTHVMIHTERKKEHTCEVCGKGFFLKYNLASHMVMHKDERPHKCQICNYAFKTARLLKNHVGVHNNDKPYSCTQCGRCFRLRRQLDSHSIIHTDIHPYVCLHCNKRFRFKTILNNHVRLHTGVKPYSCETCQRDFSNWSNYNKHMKRKHNMDTAKKKHTPEGVYPIDPDTGKVVVREETNQMLEWKKMMLLHRGLGRPPKTVQENQTNESLIQL